MIIVDTDPVLELLKSRPQPEVLAWWDCQIASDLFLTVITEAELRYGPAVMSPEPRTKRLAQGIDYMLSEYFDGRILPFERAAAGEYAALMSQRRLLESSFDGHTGMIAAIARQRGAAVATRNTRDFADCGIPLVNPWETGGSV